MPETLAEFGQRSRPSTLMMSFHGPIRIAASSSCSPVVASGPASCRSTSERGDGPPDFSADHIEMESLPAGTLPPAISTKVASARQRDTLRQACLRKATNSLYLIQ